MRILLATGNKDKVSELRELFPGATVDAAPEGFDVDETGTTLLQNAMLKAEALRREVDDDAVVMADDSGLFVRALGGRPGVFSSRYAGPEATYEDNCRRLLEELDGATDRRAAFAAVLVGLGPGGWTYVSCGTSGGEIVPAPRGSGGFGYDPVFMPDGDLRTMAEMTRDEKAAISHRGRAARRMASALGLAA